MVEKRIQKMYKNDLDKAIGAAAHAHAAQKRLNGEPYILHPIRVMLKQKTDLAKLIAVLHDVVEDTDLTMEDVLHSEFENRLFISETLGLLTRDEDMSYEDYIEKIEMSGSSVAIDIKIADLEDNMDLLGIPKVTDKIMLRMQKYKIAWGILTKAREEFTISCQVLR
jgi:(p)ppGpp synthase/HD superfamily hydrolase